MTVLYLAPTIREAPAPPQGRLATRREALQALDSFVRPMLAQKLRMPFALGQPEIDLTVYEQVPRRTNAGGHWNVTSRWFGFVGHTIGSYAVTLHFDDTDRPAHFTISGLREVATEDATPESLARGLDLALQAGPLVTWAPNTAPGISL